MIIIWKMMMPSYNHALMQILLVNLNVQSSKSNPRNIKKEILANDLKSYPLKCSDVLMKQPFFRDYICIMSLVRTV